MLIFALLDQIDDNPFQARLEYGDVAELANRIAAARDSYPDTYGLMQIPRGRLVVRNSLYPHGEPITESFRVPEKPEHWDRALKVQLAFGHRRLRAFRHLYETGAPGYQDGRFPVHVDALTDEQMLDAVWSENRERKDITAVEEAELLARKLERLGNQRAVAEAWGIARPTVANKLQLLQLPEEIKQANRDGRLSERACLALAPVLKVQAAVSKWKTNYYSPESPAEYISKLLANPNGTTSDDIRKYADRAVKHAGEELPQFVANFETGVSGPIRQTLCKGCEFRINNHCLDSACLKAKEAVVIDCVLDDAAEELDVQVSDRQDDFALFDDYQARRQLINLWKSGGQRQGTNFVIRWQPSGSGARPFLKYVEEYISGDRRFDNDGRAGIALGHRGPLPLDLIPDGEGQPAEDIASAVDRAAWDKEAKKIGEEAGNLAKAALVDALYLPAGDAADVIQALMCDPDKEWIDGYEKLLKQFVTFMWEKGRGFQSYYKGWKHVAAVRRVLDRAGLNADKLLTTGSPGGDLRRDAILALQFWYDRRNYGQYDWPECQKALTAVLARWPAVLDRWPAEVDGELLGLRYELLRAQRDVEAKLAEQADLKAAREARAAEAGSLAGEEDAEFAARAAKEVSGE